ncbi:MAG: EAL domain-containing protein, partial [Vulcanimicrobiaceae bacterium]
MRNALPVLRFEEMEVYYQPIVNAQSRKITAVEALVRWNSPELGVVEPADFLDSLIARGEIASLDEWVLTRALGDYSDLAAAGGRNVRMHVNVSAQRAVDESFAASVESIIRETRMDPRFLELELTELSAVRDVPRVAKSIIRLQDQGIGFSLDDFG